MKKLPFVILSVSILLLGGCVSVSDETTNEKIAELQGLMEDQEVTINELKASLESMEKNPSSPHSVQNLFPIYGLDQEALDEEINFYVELPGSLTLENRLKLLANELSRFKFSGLPIEVLKIEESEEGVITTVNLKEISPDSLVSWKTSFFQGSAGGSATSLTLTKTFLQPDYKGEWIDGLEFYYEGQPMGDWDHLDLKGIKYRP